MIRQFILGSIAALAFATTAPAQSWPEKPITLVVPFQAGGVTDIVTRKLEPGLSQVLGQRVVVVNIGGHSAVGTRRVIDAAPDGYEFLVHEAGIMTAQASGVMDFGYRDLKPVAAAAELCLVVVGRKDRGWKTVADVAAGANGAPLVAGVTIGGTSHIAVAKAAEIAGFEMRPVQTEGTAAAYAMLLGGHIDLMSAAPSRAQTYVYDKDGKPLAEPEAIPLLYLGAERHPLLPDVQSMKEVGSDETLCIPNLIFAPKGTPDAIVERMAAALKEAYAMPDGLLDFYRQSGGVDLFKSGSDLDAYLDDLWSVLAPIASAK